MMAMLLQQTVRVSLKTWMIYQYGHARELLVLQAVAHRIPTKLHLKEGGKLKARAGYSGFPNTPICTYRHSGVAQIALQVWWCRRQDYAAM